MNARPLTNSNLQSKMNEQTELTKLAESWLMTNLSHIATVTSTASLDYRAGKRRFSVNRMLVKLTHYRHIMAVRAHEEELLFSIHDVLPRWLRTASKAGEPIDIYRRVVQAALQGIPDEDLLDEDPDTFPTQAGTHFNDLGTRYKAGLDIGKEIASEMAKYGAKEFAQRLDALRHFMELLKSGVIPVVYDSSVPVAITVSDQLNEQANRTQLALMDQAVQEAMELPESEEAVQNGNNTSLPDFSIRQSQTIRPRGRPAEGRRHRRFNQTARTIRATTPNATMNLASQRISPTESVTCEPPRKSRRIAQSPQRPGESPASRSRRLLSALPGMNVQPVHTHGNIPILQEDLDMLNQVGLELENRLLNAGCWLLRREFPQCAGLEDPGQIALCNPDNEAVARIKRAVSCKQKIIQPLYNGRNHYVTAYYTEQDKVRLFCSVGGSPGPLLQLQLFMLFNTDENDLHVEMPTMPCQALSSNNCLIYAFAYAFDLASKNKVETANYVAEVPFRQ